MSIALPTRLRGLDTLRALAIVLVFAQHYQLFVSGRATFGWFGTIGWSGVDLFFALSGYLIGNQIMAGLGQSRRAEDGVRFSLARFYGRRLLRTLPNYYVILALYACWPLWRGASTLPPLWQFLTFTQNIGLVPGTAFSHAWSLCVEEQFYMVLPVVAVAIAATRRPLLWAWGALALTVLMGLLLRSHLWDERVEQGGFHYYTLIYYASLCRCDELVAGVGLALLKNYHASVWARVTAHGHWALALGAALLALTWALFLDDRYGYLMTVLGYPMLALSFSLLLVAALSPGSLLQALHLPGAASLAAWSYAIYLIHKPLCVLLRTPLQLAGWGPDSWPAIILLSGASVLAGALLHQLVEMPFMWLRQRYLPGNFSPAIPLR